MTWRQPLFKWEAAGEARLLPESVVLQAAMAVALFMSLWLRAAVLY
jgi:hypothetical protein